MGIWEEKKEYMGSVHPESFVGPLVMLMVQKEVNLCASYKQKALDPVNTLFLHCRLPLIASMNSIQQLQDTGHFQSLGPETHWLCLDQTEGASLEREWRGTGHKSPLLPILLIGSFVHGADIGVQLKTISTG